MKVRASIKADPSKGDKIVRRRGRLYVINKKDPNRKQRQKGPAKKRQVVYMARKAMVAKEKRRQRSVNIRWEKRQDLKKIISSPTVSEEEKMNAVRKLNLMSKNSSSVRLRNRCLITGRARGYLRKFKLSRLCFRELASDVSIPGVTKASWQIPISFLFRLE